MKRKEKEKEKRKQKHTVTEIPSVARNKAPKSCNIESKRQVIPIFLWSVTCESKADLFRTIRTRMAAPIMMR